MIQIRTPLALAAIILSSVASPVPLSGQGPGPSRQEPGPSREEPGARFLSLGLSAGAGAADARRRDDSWDFGPVFGGRIEWSRGTTAASLNLDVQPFKAGRTDQPGDYRAVYLLPTLGLGPPGSRIGIGVGMGVFDFTSEGGETERKVGFVSGLSGSTRVTGSVSLELAWKRIRNVSGLRSNVFLLQMVKRWRL